jgi:HPt (histidine-containing phosphotransfer) domain-containing protein
MGSYTYGCYADIAMSQTDQLRPTADSLASDSQITWNRSAALQMLGGDEELLTEMVEIFLSDSPKLLARMEQALAVGDSSKLELAAHSLKGELQYLGVPEAIDQAQQLEIAGRDGKLDGAEDLLAAVRIRLSMIWSAVSQFAGN